MQRAGRLHPRLLLFVLAGLVGSAGCFAMSECRGVKRGLMPSERDLAARLEHHVRYLAGRIGERSYLTPTKLAEAATYIEKELCKVEGSQGRVVPSNLDLGEDLHQDKKLCEIEGSQGSVISSNIYPSGNLYRNIELSVPGSDRPDEIVVIGAHYDSDAYESGGSNPGADDNASGVAALIELAQRFATRRHSRTLRFVAFTNEEEPFFHTPEMGSRVYARKFEGRIAPAKVKAMLSLETIGYYTDEGCTQKGVLLPSTGNFLAFIANWSSYRLALRTAERFCKAASFPAEVVLAPEWVPGVGWSDHWSFWKFGYPAVMITDTAPNRNFGYHKGCDIPDRLDYMRMAVVVDGIAGVIEALADEP